MVNIHPLHKSDVTYRIYYKSNDPKLKGEWLADQTYISNAKRARVEVEKFRQRADVIKTEVVKEVTTRKILS